MAAVGTLIGGRYRLDAVIGRGGMSTVYKAFDTVLERPVAIKLMHREIATDSDQLERFRREARSVAQLNHPNVVSVIDAGEEPLPEDEHAHNHDGAAGTPYIVLEYVDGETLKSVIRRDGPLEIPQALAYAIEIARALGAAHERQIVHRDVKPHNVLIDPEGGAKITDFGIARSLSEEGLTMAGRVLGTTDYVSPEQALGQPVTPQSDLYSLGIVLYEMLTGDVPVPRRLAGRGGDEARPRGSPRRAGPPPGDLRRDRLGRRPRGRQGPRAALPRRRRDDVRPRKRAGDRGLAHRADDRRGDDGAAQPARPGAAPAALAHAPPGALARLAWRCSRRSSLILVSSPAKTPIAAPASRPAPPRSAGLVAVPLGQSSAHDYNPFGTGPENRDQIGNVVDSDPTTTWSTERYYEGTLHKAGGTGLGVYLDASPGVIGRGIEIQTPTPGFAVQIYVADKIEHRCPSATPASLASRGWKGPVGASAERPRRRTDPPAPAGRAAPLLPDVDDDAPAAHGVGDDRRHHAVQVRRGPGAAERLAPHGRRHGQLRRAACRLWRSSASRQSRSTSSG